MYKLRLEKRATKALQKIAEPMKARIIKALDEMTRDPFSGDISPCKVNGKISIVGVWEILELSIA